jgi:hypothetical protein
MFDYREKICISMSLDEEIINEQITYLLKNHFYPELKVVEDTYLIIIVCSEKEFEKLRKEIPYNVACPIKIITQPKEEPVYYAMPFPKD